jgi:cystathionine beta-synthase
VHESVSAARAALAAADAVLVVSDGKPVGVLTRQDLLTFLTA